MAKSDELIKYITQQVVTYIDTPADIRKENRKALQGQKEPWQSKWFGMVPFAIHMWLTQRKKYFRDKKRTPPST